MLLLAWIGALNLKNYQIYCSWFDIMTTDRNKRASKTFGF
jgi:hypothetical protein